MEIRLSRTFHLKIILYQSTKHHIGHFNACISLLHNISQLFCQDKESTMDLIIFKKVKNYRGHNTRIAQHISMVNN